MTSRNIVIKNTTWLFLSNLVGHIFSFILVIMIARTLGEEGLGVYSFAFSFTMLAAFLFDFGVLNLMVKEVARDKTKQHKYIGNIITLKFILSIIAYIVPVALIWTLDKPLITKQAAAIAGLAMFFHYFGYTYRSIFQAFEKLEYEAIARVAERSIALGLGIFFISRGYGIIALCWLLTVSYGLYFILLLIFTTIKIGVIKPRFNFPFWKKIMKESLPFWLTMLFTALYFKIDISMITLLVKDNPSAATGWYNAAYTIIDGLFFIPLVATTALYPAMSQLFKRSIPQLKELYRKAAYYLCILAFPLGVGTTFLARRIIYFLYGDGFAPSFVVLQILIWAEAILFIAYLMGFLLNSIDKQHLFTIAAGVCAIGNIILNFILIPRYSFTGAAVTTFITEALSFGMLFYFTTKEGYGLNLFKLTWKAILASCFMGLFIWKFSMLHILIILPLSAAVYFLVLMLLNGIEAEEIELVLSKLVRN